MSLKYSNEENEGIVKELRDKLGEKCSAVGRKGRQFSEFKFIFVRKGINARYVHNSEPEQLRFRLFGLVGTEPVNMETKRDHP